MNLSELIEQVKEEKPNAFKEAKLISFINEIESDVQEELDLPQVARVKYVSIEADGDKQLLVESPYDRLYKSYLKAMIDYSNEEYQSYENNQAQHIADYKEWINHLVRTGRARSMPRRFKNIF